MNSSLMKWLEKNISTILVMSGIAIVVFPWLLSLPAFIPCMDISRGGTIGDAIGGTTAPIIGVLSIILLVLTLKAQKDADYRSQLESRIFQLIKMQQENVNSMQVKDSDVELYGRDVFSMIMRQLKFCIREIKPFIDNWEGVFFTDEFNRDYENLGISIEKKKYAIIDMAFSIVYIGVDLDSLKLLESVLCKRYNEDIVRQVVLTCRLRPFRKAQKTFDEWQKWDRLPFAKKQLLLSSMYTPYEEIMDKKIESFIRESFPLLHKHTFNKYYTGHQFRLGHYYRNLYMAIEYITNEQALSEEEKYNYVKIIRSQLSTTEQILLMINSLTYLGREWELFAEKDKKYFSRYNLIKNIPQEKVLGFEYRKVYPNIEYEV